MRALWRLSYQGMRDWLVAIAWIHAALGATAVIPFNLKARDRSRLPSPWTAAELGKPGAIERFFARLFRAFVVQRPPLAGWAAVTRCVALSFTVALIVASPPTRPAAQTSSAPPNVSSPTSGRPLAELGNALHQ